MTGGGAAAGEEEVAPRKLIGAGFAKMVAHFFGHHAEKISFPKRRRQVGPKASSTTGPVSSGNNASGEKGDAVADLVLSNMEEGEGRNSEMALRTSQLVNDAPPDKKAEDEDALRQTQGEEALRQNNKPVSALSSEIVPEDEEDSIEAPDRDKLMDTPSMKIFVQQMVMEAFSGAFDTTDGSAELKGFVRDTVKQAMEDHRLSATLPRDPIPPIDTMKLVQDAMSEHQTFSRVLYVLALGTPITLLIARAVRDKDNDKLPDKTMIRNTALEMGFSFLAVSVCHLYVIIFHFVRTEAPRLSIWATRIIIIFLCTIVSSWIVVYAFHMPERLFQTFFWWIIGPFLAANWILSAGVGCTGFLKQHCLIKVDRS